MKYSIEQISKAWIEFSKPLLLINNKKVDESSLKYGGFVECNNPTEAKYIARMDFISFLINYYDETSK